MLFICQCHLILQNLAWRAGPVCSIHIGCVWLLLQLAWPQFLCVEHCVLLAVLCICMVYFLLCGLRLCYAQSQFDDGHVHATAPRPARAVAQGRHTISCFRLAILPLVSYTYIHVVITAATCFRACALRPIFSCRHVVLCEVSSWKDRCESPFLCQEYRTYDHTAQW